MYCADISCFDSLMIDNGFKQTGIRKESNGKYTEYTEESYDSENLPGPTVITYAVTTKKEIAITIITYNEPYAKDMEYDIQLPSLKFGNSFESGKKLCYTSEKHPKVTLCISKGFNFDYVKNQMTVSIIKKP